MTDVFISYKAEDRERVRLLVDALVADGLKVWWDVGIEGGASWRQTIQDQLDSATCVLVVWSRRSVGRAGYFVQDEAAHAQRRGVYLPVAMDAVEPPLGFGQEQVLSLTDWRGDRADQRFLDVLAAIRAFVASSSRPTPMARWRAAGRDAGRLRIAAYLLVVLLAIGGLLVAKAPARLCVAARLDCSILSSPARVKARNSIAVLPFANLSGDPSQDYFADGLSEELIAALSRLEPLKVVARSSSFQFKGSKEGAVVIGAKLSVAYLLDGAVRRDGDRVRVSAQLADTRTGYEQWSETYDRDMKDIFAVQSGIAEAVAQALKVRLVDDDIAALSQQGGTSDPKAYDAFLRGRALLRMAAGAQDYAAALSDYDAAINADAKFAKAHAGRAVALMDIASTPSTPAAARETDQAALDSARQAAALAPKVAAIQVVLAEALIAANRDFQGAALAFARAFQEGGGDANVLMEYGIFRCQTGDCAGAATTIRRATQLDPLDPLPYRWLGWALIGAHRNADAIPPLRRALQLSPHMESIHAAIGDALLLQGSLNQAKLEYRREPLSWARLTGQAIVLNRLGDAAGARAAFAALLDEGGDTVRYQQAEVLAQWGDLEGAFAALDVAIRTGDQGAAFLEMDPLMEPLRRDPRFAERLALLGLSPVKRSVIGI